MKYEDETLYTEIAEYCNGNTAVILYTEDGEPYVDLTVNLDILMPEYAFIDTNNFSDAEKLIKKYGLGTPTGAAKQSGFCTYPLYKLNMDALKKYEYKNK